MISKKYLAPNAITATSMFLGFLSITASIKLDFSRAVLFIILAMVCDGLDGKTARKLDAFSEFGKEFDSFADAFSFGMAPGILIYSKLMNETNITSSLIMPVAFLYVFCGVMRLVKFNIITTASSEKGDFSGMPIPNAASMVCSYLMICQSVAKRFNYNLFNRELFIAISILAAILMVSTIPFKTPERTFPFIPKKLAGIFILIVVVTLNYSLFICTFAYVIINLLNYITKRYSISNGNKSDEDEDTSDDDSDIEDCEADEEISEPYKEIEEEDTENKELTTAPTKKKSKVNTKKR